MRGYRDSITGKYTDCDALTIMSAPYVTSVWGPPTSFRNASAALPMSAITANVIETWLLDGHESN